MNRRCVTLALVSAALLAAGTSRAAQLITRTLMEKPAIVLAAFGTSTKAQATYAVFEHQLHEALPGYEVRWAFTSEVIREKVNARRAKEGSSDRLKSLPQALADLQAEGYTRVAVQPLHILPGEEYEEVLGEVKGFPGLRIEVGETLLHRWESVHEVIGILARDFLPPDQGANVLVAHGSPTTAAATNAAFLGIDRYLSRRYPNAFLGCVEGIVSGEDALAAAKAHPGGRVRFLPLLFVGGDHAINDIMGDTDSWRAEVTAAGKQADMPTVELAGETQYRGLGLIPEVNRIFVREIERSLSRL
ncbi:MAG: sirohydrochlorin cobaltochelatase [Deltaproteobacteria bacterium]|nr:sirohydrochlorin cobaltochelatase [Deltaproteobacteria bacterium]